MADHPKPAADRSYVIGNVGPGARVAQGENISWVEGVAGTPGGAALVQQFQALLARIGQDPALDDDTRDLAAAKTAAVAEGVATVAESPAALRRALIDGKGWFGSSVSWVGQTLSEILKSEAARKVLGDVTDSATKTAIDSFLK